MSAVDNPSAFPCSERRNTSTDPFATPREITHTGMTLRDWFAGQAPPAPDNFTIASAECDDWHDSDKSNQAWSDWTLRRAVAWSNAYADAMLAARATQGEQQ